MSGLDDAGMHRPDGDLVHAVAFHRQEAIGQRVRQCVGTFSKRKAHAPLIVIGPGTGVGQGLRDQAEQVVHGALQAQRRWMVHADGGINPIGAIQAENSDFRRIAIHDRHMHRRRFAPQAKQAEMSLRQLVDHKFPEVRTDLGAWPWAALPDLAAFQNAIDQRRHILFILSEEAGDMLEPGNERRGKIDPGT